ncbi:MAG TPA: TolC family protein [Gemmatimonadales bacterium]|nr:TolC family protein [Gemmatimonadales bacterium]
MTRWLYLLAFGALAAPLAAQDSTPAAPPPAVSLTLAEALELARRNSPAFRQVRNDAGPARWAVRNAYGNLLPTVNSGVDFGYTGSGQSNFGGGFTRATSPYLSSGYGLNLQWQLDGTRLSAVGQQKANQRATEEEIAGAEHGLTVDVTLQYLTALQAAAQVAVARQQVARNEEFLQLAQARYRVGQGTLLEVRQAEVQKAQSEVQLLRNLQAENDAKLELLRRMGVTPPAPVERIELTDSFPVTAPEYRLDQLLAMAEERNPSLRALRAREDAAEAGVRAAKSAFLPSLTLQAGWSGFTQEFTDDGLVIGGPLASARETARNCEFQNNLIRALPGGGIPNEPNGGLIPDCNAFAGLNGSGTALDPALEARIRKQNDVFPFDYTAQPFRATLSVSLPIFTGFGRSLRLSQARAQREDAEEGVRARALQVRSEVHSRFLNLETAYRAIAVQEVSRRAAREQLQLAQDRYRLGSGTSLEVTDAQNAVQRAEADYVNAVYDYHKALAALEAAVGRPLR